MRSVMNLFDTFMDDFYDGKYMEGISDLDERAQLEVSTHFFLTAVFIYYHHGALKFVTCLTNWHILNMNDISDSVL